MVSGLITKNTYESNPGFILVHVHDHAADAASAAFASRDPGCVSDPHTQSPVDHGDLSNHLFAGCLHS